MERGRGWRPRRGGGGRRRPSGDRRSGPDRESSHGARRGYGAARERAVHPEPERKDGDDAVEGQEEEEDVTAGFSRRKIVSNWDRYEEAKKEAENKVLQRGTDYAELLNSAGDSFTQFRFAEEKEWEAENPCNKQGTAAFLDSKALAKALQELPLYLRLNVEAESIQEDLLQELPQLKPHSVSSQAAAIAPVFPVQGSNPGPKTSMNSRQQATPEASQSAADEDLDFLLSLDAAIAEERHERQLAESERENEEADLQPMQEESGTVTSDSAGSPAEEKQKATTEEDLEDWLDSMIS